MEAFEILTSESQERMLAIVHPSKLERVRAVCAKWGLATGKGQIEQLFTDFGAGIRSILHDYATFNWIMTGTDVFAVEGTSAGEYKDGAWRAGVTHAGRWCDVFEVRDFLIQRCFIYLDPDYAGLDTARYPWLSAGGRDPSKPMG